jgi:hypothetical protein
MTGECPLLALTAVPLVTLGGCFRGKADIDFASQNVCR